MTIRIMTILLTTILLCCISITTPFQTRVWGQPSYPLSVQIAVTDTIHNSLENGTHKVKLKFWSSSKVVSLNATTGPNTISVIDDSYTFNVAFLDGYFTLKFGDNSSPLPENWLRQENSHITVEIEKAATPGTYFDAIIVKPTSIFTAKYAEIAESLPLNPTFNGILRGPTAHFTDSISVNGTITAGQFKGDGSQLTGVVTASVTNSDINKILKWSGTAWEATKINDLITSAPVYRPSSDQTLILGPGNEFSISENLVIQWNAAVVTANLIHTTYAPITSPVFKNTLTLNGILTATEIATTHLTATTVTINSLTMIGFGGDTLPKRHPFFENPWTQSYPRLNSIITNPGPPPTLLVKNGLTIYSKENPADTSVSQNPTLYFQYTENTATKNAAFIRLEPNKHFNPNVGPHDGVLRYQSNGGHMFMTVWGTGYGSGYFFDIKKKPVPQNPILGSIEGSEGNEDNKNNDAIYQFKFYANATAPVPESLFNIGQYGTQNTADYIHFTTNTEVVGKLSTHQAEIAGIAQTGIKLESTGADYAEYLPRKHKDEPIEAGDIIGVHAGKITKTTSGAHRIMVISTMPIVVGNWKGKNNPNLYEAVTFIGQVPVKVRGSVTAGDYIIPSGHNDGIGIAVPESELLPEHHSQIVGQAWESNPKTDIKKINMAIVPLLGLGLKCPKL
jgi:hypothetical protein